MGYLFQASSKWKGRDFTCWSIPGRVGKSDIWSVKRPNRVNRWILCLLKSRENVLILWFTHILTCVAGVRKGRGRELWRETTRAHILPSPFPFNACHTGYSNLKDSAFTAVKRNRDTSCQKKVHEGGIFSVREWYSIYKGKALHPEGVPPRIQLCWVPLR